MRLDMASVRVRLRPISSCGTENGMQKHAGNPFSRGYVRGSGQVVGRYSAVSARKVWSTTVSSFTARSLLRSWPRRSDTSSILLLTLNVDPVSDHKKNQCRACRQSRLIPVRSAAVAEQAVEQRQAGDVRPLTSLLVPAVAGMFLSRVIDGKGTVQGLVRRFNTACQVSNDIPVKSDALCCD